MNQKRGYKYGKRFGRGQTANTFSAWINIYGNVLITNNVCMQIKNVSQVFAGQLPKKGFPTWSLLLLLAGIVGIAIDSLGRSLIRSREPSSMLVLGIFALIIWGVILLVYVLSKPVFGLHIVMNSGTTYTFTSYNSGYIKEAYDVLCERFNKPENNETYVTLNFGAGTIVSHPKIGGNMNL